MAANQGGRGRDVLDITAGYNVHKRPDMPLHCITGIVRSWPVAHCQEGLFTLLEGKRTCLGANSR